MFGSAAKCLRNNEAQRRVEASCWALIALTQGNMYKLSVVQPSAVQPITPVHRSIHQFNIHKVASNCGMHLLLLVVVVVVDARVPAVSWLACLPRANNRPSACKEQYANGREIRAVHVQEGLVSVAPGEVLGADVLVRVLGALLKRGEMGPVLPMLVPEVIGVQAGDEKAGDDGAGRDIVSRVCIDRDAEVRECVWLWLFLPHSRSPSFPPPFVSSHNAGDPSSLRHLEKSGARGHIMVLRHFVWHRGWLTEKGNG